VMSDRLADDVQRARGAFVLSEHGSGSFRLMAEAERCLIRLLPNPPGGGTVKVRFACTLTSTLARYSLSCLHIGP
jgi:hypothetical protein